MGKNFLPDAYPNEILLPKTLKKIELQNFLLWELEEGNEIFYEENGILFNKNDKDYYFWNKKREISKHIKIKDGYENILECCFYNCTYIESVELPESLKAIKKQAFYYCSNLKEIKFPQTTAIKIESGSFGYCINIKSIIIQNIEYFEGDAFESNHALEYVNISNIIKCDDYFSPFGWCHMIRKFEDMESESIRIINNTIYCKNTDNSNYKLVKFASQSEATEIEVDCSYIDSYAFGSVVNLRKVSIKNVISITFDAFTNCENLEEIILPQSIREVKRYSFINCDKLCIITENNNQTIINNLISYGIPRNLLVCGKKDETYDIAVYIYRTDLFMIITASTSLLFHILN